MPLTRPKAHQLSGQSAKSSVRVVTTSNVTLSGGAPATVDGVSLTLEDRILVTAQTDATENGIYRVTTVGSGSNGTWVRGRDANQNEEVLAGMTTMVSEGTTYADTFWKLSTDGAVTLGTTELTFEQHSTVEAKSIANLSDVTLTSTSSNDVLTYNGSAWVNSTSIDLSGNIDGANINVDDTLRIAQSGSGLRMTNVGAFDNDGSDNFRVFGTNDLILAANGESGTAITIDATNQDVAVSNDLTVSGNITTGNVTIVDATITATGNITTSGSFIGDGSQLTGLPAGYTDANVTSLLSNLGSNNISTAGSITVSGRVATDEVSAHGLSSTSSLTLRGGTSSDGIKLQFWDSSWTDALSIRESTHDILASYPFTATGNITGGNIITGGLVDAAKLTVDTNTLHVDPTNNRVGIGTTTPAYQVEIENTSNNALLVLDRTDGASTFIEGGATDSVLGSVGANDVKIAYNSVPVVTIGSGGAITTSGNITGGNLRADNLTTENAFAIVGSDNNLIQDTTLSVDPASNYLGINQTSPEVTLHMTGEGAQTAQIRMEQYNDSADAPDLRTRRYRGNIASPSAVSSGDYLYRSNHEYWNGSALIVGGTFAFDNTNDANRTQFAVSVTTDGTSADANTPSKVQFKIDGNDSGAITFNNAYKFPTADGSANQVLQTDGSGTLTFADQSAGGATYSTGNTAPVSPSVGDKWFDTDDEILFEYINDGTSNVWVDTTSASTGDSTTGDYAITGDFTASGNISQGPAGYQSNKYILYGTTTNADTTEIFIGGGSNSRVPVGNNVTMFYTVDIVARRTDATGESAGWTLKGVVDNVAGNVQNVGNVYEVAVASDDGNWAVDVVADNTDDAVNVVVTGAAGKTVKWMATVETQEITE